MKIQSFFVSVLAASFLIACGQSAEERVKAYEEAHGALMAEYNQMMDSLSADREKAQAFYDEFVERYVEFNLEAAKKNPDNDVAIQAHYRSLISI